MRLHRFYIDQEINLNSQIVISSAPLVHQIRRVFRLGAGDSVIVFNGTHFDYECKIDGENKKSTIVSDKEIRLNVVATTRSRFQPARDIYLCASLVKKDTFEWIVEKATELGVSHIVPILSERSEKKSLNAERLNKIAIEASEQSGRGSVPVIQELKTLEEVIAQGLQVAGDKKNSKINLVAFHTEGERFSEDDAHEKEPIACFIGPEGGWSETEIDVFHKNGIAVRSLGDQVLRAETAVVAALSQVVFR